MATLERMYVTPFIISVIYTTLNYYVLTSFTMRSVISLPSYRASRIIYDSMPNFETNFFFFFFLESARDR